MPLPQARFTVRRMMAIVGGLAIVMGGLVALYRQAESEYRRKMAEYEAACAQACLRRIPDDMTRAFLCGKWAVDGREPPFGFVNNVQCSGMVNPAEEYRKMVVERSLPGVPGARDRYFPGWVSESIWRATEAGHDASRAWWHWRMRSQWELAPSEPMSPRPVEPPMPYPDF
jgi:hypothetical protein